ncbi:hypothetical protein ACFQ07_14520, partial [Actinomadura adrarensis]
MPTYEHEVPLHMIRQRPHLAVEILRGACGLEIPDHDEVVVVSENLSTMHPAELVCDNAVLAKRNGTVTYGVVVENQLQSPRRKLFSWPAYVSTYRHRHECDVTLLVLCRDKAAAERSAEPIYLGPPGSVVYPVGVCP